MHLSCIVVSIVLVVAVSIVLSQLLSIHSLDCLHLLLQVSLPRHRSQLCVHGRCRVVVVVVVMIVVVVVVVVVLFLHRCLNHCSVLSGRVAVVVS